MSEEYDRRTVLKLTSGITSGFMAVGTAAADDDSSSLDNFNTQDCNCYYEDKCEDSCIDDPTETQYWERECCECDNGTTCDDWTRVRCCR